MRTKIIFVDNSWYDGDAVNGIPHGIGTYFIDVFQYTGLWTNGVSSPYLNTSDTRITNLTNSNTPITAEDRTTRLLITLGNDRDTIIDCVDTRIFLNTNKKQRKSEYVNNKQFTGMYDNGILTGFVVHKELDGKDEGQYLNGFRYGRKKNTHRFNDFYMEYEIRQHGIMLIFNTRNKNRFMKSMRFYNDDTWIGYEKTYKDDEISERIHKLDGSIFVNMKRDDSHVIRYHLVGYVHISDRVKSGRMIYVEGNVFMVDKEKYYNVNGNMGKNIYYI